MDDGQPTPAKRPAVTSPGSAFRAIGSMDSSPNSHVPATLPHPNPGSVYPQALLASNLPYPGAAGAGIRQDPNLTEHELQESLHALQQLFERECTSLYVNFQEAHAQLAAKHYQYSQRVVQEFMERQHQEQIARSAVANVPILRAASEQSMDQPRALGQLPLAAPLSNQQNRRGDQRATGPAPSSSSVSSLGQKNDQTGSKGSLSRTVSVETKNKLKAMIFNKQQAKLRQARSHVEIRRGIHGGAGSRNNGQPLAQSGRPVKSKDRSVDRIGGPANDHYEQTQPSRHSPLRKAVSEPDLKTKGQKRSMGGMPVDPSHENDVAPVSSGSWQVLAAAGPSVRSMGMLSPIEGSGDLAERSMRDVDAMDRLNAAHRNLLMAMGGGPRPPPRLAMMPPPLGYHGIHPRGAVDVLRNYSGCPLPIGLLSSELAASAPLLSLPTVPIGQGRGSAIDIMSPGRVRPQEPHIPAHMSISSPVPRNPLDGNLPGALSDTNILRAKAALSASHGSGSMDRSLRSQIRDIVLRRSSSFREEQEDPEQRQILMETEASTSTTTLEKNGENEMAMRLEASTSSRITSTGVTGIAYDHVMCKHQCGCGNDGVHLEHPGRIRSIWARLNERDLLTGCEHIHGKRAPLEHLKLVHDDAYVDLFANLTPGRMGRLDLSAASTSSFAVLPCGGVGVDADTYFNEQFTSVACRFAVGLVTELALSVAEGHLKNGFALVRPPGHHAEAAQPSGFCYFNSVAIAAALLKQQMGLRRIAIIDWDVHHGNGTQFAFENDPTVLFLSLHRHDDGNFFPGTGSLGEVGKGAGAGFTVNIPWSGAPMGDSEYLAAWRAVVMPILQAFDPEFILVSAGYDGAAGHPANLGGYNLTAALFGYITRELMTLASGKVVLALEGGYDLATICDCAEHSVRALLGRDRSGLSTAALRTHPNSSAVLTLHRVISIHKKFWPGLSPVLIDIPHAAYTQTDRQAAPASVIRLANDKRREVTPVSVRSRDSESDIDVVGTVDKMEC